MLENRERFPTVWKAQRMKSHIHKQENSTVRCLFSLKFILGFNIIPRKIPAEIFEEIGKVIQNLFRNAKDL